MKIRWIGGNVGFVHTPEFVDVDLFCAAFIVDRDCDGWKITLCFESVELFIIEGQNIECLLAEIFVKVNVVKPFVLVVVKPFVLVGHGDRAITQSTRSTCENWSILSGRCLI